jgi:diguanylate cyclase (GGDEF)-like protein/PAS domain S-box-containing protein
MFFLIFWIALALLTSTLIALALVLIIAIPISWFVIIVPLRLQAQLAKAYDDIKVKSDIIDENVMVEITDKEGIIQNTSTFFTELTGYRRDEAIGNTHDFFKHPDTIAEPHKILKQTILNGETWTGELKYIHKNGNAFWVKMVITPNFNDDGEIVTFTAISHDITDKKVIAEISITDRLTGLFNRRRIAQLVSQEIAISKRYERDFSAVLFDIDHFKQVNDQYGHQVADNALIQLTDILQTNTRESDIICRWDGGQFLIIARETKIDEAFTFADKLRKKIEEHKFTDIGLLTIHCGIAQYNKGETPSSLFSRADSALDEAKESSTNKIVKKQIKIKAR